MSPVPPTATAGQTLDLRPHPSSAGAARRFVRDYLSAAGLADFVESAGLLVSELVTNSLLHARTMMRVEILHSEQPAAMVRVAVHDECPALGFRRPFSPDATTGRGLLLVESLADDWGSESTGWGKVTWFILGQPAGGQVAASPS